MPDGAPLIAIEQSEKSISINAFQHPERAVYLLGAEDHGLSGEILEKCRSIIHINTVMCINVAVAGSIVMFHRNLALS